MSATDGVGLITDNGVLTPPSQPSPLSQLFWVAPLKFDAVYMRFELAIRRSSNAPHAELQLYSTRATYLSVSTSVTNRRSRCVRRAPTLRLSVAMKSFPHANHSRASTPVNNRQTFKTALGIMRKSSGDGPARQGAGLLSPSFLGGANIQCSKELGGSNPPPRASRFSCYPEKCDWHMLVDIGS